MFREILKKIQEQETIYLSDSILLTTETTPNLNQKPINISLGQLHILSNGVQRLTVKKQTVLRMFYSSLN